jgi:VanZ family protein
MTFLVNTSFSTKKINIGRFAVLLGTLIIGTIITFEEFSQIFLPHRNFEIMDLICNYAGILAGSFISQNKIT